MGLLSSFSLFPCCWVGCEFSIWDGTQVTNLSHIIVKFLSHSHSEQWYFIDHLVVGYEWSEHQWVVSNHPNLKDFLRFYLHAQTHYHHHHHHLSGVWCEFFAAWLQFLLFTLMNEVMINHPSHKMLMIYIKQKACVWQHLWCHGHKIRMYHCCVVLWFR